MRWTYLVLPLAIASVVFTGFPDFNTSPARSQETTSGQSSVTKDLTNSQRLLKEVSASPFPAYIPGEGIPVWSADGRYLAFSKPTGLAVILVNRAVTLRKVNDRPSFDPAWSPDSSRIAFIRERPDHKRSIFLQSVYEREDVDILPDDFAARGIKEMGLIHRWLNPSVVAFDAFVGSGIKKLYVFDIDSRKYLPTPDLIANRFVWSADGNLVAGKNPGARTSFWIWNRKRNSVTRPKHPLPGETQVVEAFSRGGRTALFSSWNGGYPYTGQVPVGLHAIDMVSGQINEISKEAALATSSDGLVAYVRFGKKPTLVVQDSATGRILWTDELGEVTPDFQSRSESYRPQFFGSYLVYRTLTGEWRITEGAEKRVQTVYRGQEAIVSVSPDGRYLAVLDNLPEPRLLLYTNPLLAVDPS